MAVYIVADIHIKDPEAYEEYRAKVPPILEKYGDRYLVRGGEITPGEGDWSPNRIVILEVPSAEDARNFVTSEEYAPVADIRHRAAESKSFMVEGV
jgi:uncharacterized protein (DUF1330 family)